MSTHHTKKKRVLSGLQPSGQLHLGNYTGAIKQFIRLQEDHEMYVFVASYHALTSSPKPDELRANIRQVVTDYLAFGLDADKCHIYLQHDVPEVTELAWLLGCVCPKSQMDKATTYKDKVAHGLPASIGLYTYPVLQAADILCVDADLVPVGEDQRQHVEITRTLARKFNNEFGETFKVPEEMIQASSGQLPGIDGKKMSKSYGNGIDPFMPEKQLRKRIMKTVTDSTPVEDPKDPEQDATYQIFRGLAGEDDGRTTGLAERYRAGGMGYGDAKQALFELILDEFAEARERRAELMDNPHYIAEVLRDGRHAARERIRAVLGRARQAVGLD